MTFDKSSPQGKAAQKVKPVATKPSKFGIATVGNTSSHVHTLCKRLKHLLLLDADITNAYSKIKFIQALGLCGGSG